MLVSGREFSGVTFPDTAVRPAGFRLDAGRIGRCRARIAGDQGPQGRLVAWGVLAFCRARDIPTEEVSLEQRWTRDEKSHRVVAIELELKLGPGFPAKYERAVKSAAEQCAVSRLLHDPPRVDLTARRGALLDHHVDP